MNIHVIQMDMRLGEPACNFDRAEALIERAVRSKPDVICLPETWNVGFFPRENLAGLADRDGAMTRERLGALAAEYRVNIVAGTVADFRPDRGEVTNTALVFDRDGQCVAEYDKVHLFTNMGEDRYFAAGERPCVFSLDGVRCGLVVCYDLRFPEWVRETALAGIGILFVPAQWPAARLAHWQLLNRARAVENQIFVVGANSCGRAGAVRYAGHSAVIGPLGEVLSEAGEGEEILRAAIDLSGLERVRREIPVYRDRRPELYGERKEGSS